MEATTVTQNIPTRKTIIQKATNFPLEVVLRRYAHEEKISSEVAHEHARELKRYLALCALDPGENYGMRGPIDRLWHTFLIFTKLYAAFCKEVAGRFLHHEPTSEHEKKSDVSRARYQRFLEQYHVEFGEEPPAHLWPRLSQGTQQHDDCHTEGCGCAEGTCHAE